MYRSPLVTVSLPASRRARPELLAADHSGTSSGPDTDNNLILKYFFPWSLQFLLVFHNCQNIISVMVVSSMSSVHPTSLSAPTWGRFSLTGRWTEILTSNTNRRSSSIWPAAISRATTRLIGLSWLCWSLFILGIWHCWRDWYRPGLWLLGTRPNVEKVKYN